jgi:PAS domain S-box-containing protein
MIMKEDEPRRMRFHFGLAPRLIILVVLATFIVGAAVGALVLIKSRDALRGHIFDSTLETADLAVQFAAQYVDSAQTAARELVTRPAIIHAVMTGSFDQVGPRLVGFLQRNRCFDSVSILDPRGIIRVSGVVQSLNIGTSSADREWFQQVKATGKPYLGIPVLSRATGRPVVPFGVPIFDDREKLCGILVAGISLAALTDTIVKTQVGPEARASLQDFRQGGIILAHVDPKRILTPVSGQNEAVRRLLAGERGTLEIINSTGERGLTAFAPVPGAPWGILITQPSKSAFAALDALTKQVLLLGFLALLMMALTGGWLARRIIHPILTLRDASNALAAGDLTRRVKFSRRDEIGELAQVFDRMADALQAEQTVLRRRAENFFNLSLEMLCVAGFDGWFKTLNPAWEQTLGFSTAELLSRPFIEFVHPDDRQAMIEAAAKMAAGQEVVAFENRCLCQDGSHRWLTWNAVSALDEQMIYAVAHDVTDRKSAEEALLESETRFRQLVVALPQLVWTCTPDGLCDFLSPQWIEHTGVPESQLLGFQWLDQVHPDDRNALMAEWNRVVVTGEPFVIEFRIRHHSGEYNMFYTRATPLRDANGRIVKWYGLNMDITERKLMEEKLKQYSDELRRSNADLEQFAYVASHDLQEPLRMVSSYTQLLAQHYEGRLDEKAKKVYGLHSGRCGPYAEAHQRPSGLLARRNARQAAGNNGYARPPG